MKNAKFWLVQIAMVAIVSLVFGSPVFAGPPDHALGKGVEMKNLNASDKAKENANDKANFEAVPGADEEDDCQVWGTQMDANGNMIEVCQD